ncbi:MAG: GAF domain-containing protein [Anaerolineae bacterium]|nr:GAF domain-containing protein [Anaerolineae bacterium]
MTTAADGKDTQPALGYHQLLEQLGDVVFAIDSAGYFTHVTRRVRMLLDYAPEEIIGQHYEKYVAALWADHVRTLYTRILRGKDGESLVEVPMLHHSGRDVWVEQMVTPVYDEKRGVIGLAGVMRDLTGRSLTETELEKRISQLAALQRIDAELTHQLDIDYVLSMALDTALRLSTADAGGIELMREGELYTGMIIGNYPPEFLNRYPTPPTGIIERVLRERRPELVRDVKQDPDYHPNLSTTRAQMVIPLLSQDRLIGVLFLETRREDRFTTEVFEFIQLITTRIAAALDNAQLYDTTRQQLAELQNLYTQVMNLEQLKTDMIRIAAHDLGNPLTSITGFIDLLLDSEMTDNQHEYVQIVKESAQRMKKIIRDILSLQRIEELAQGSLSENVDLKELVQQLYETQKYQASHHNQVFTLDVPSFPMIVRGDAAQMREAVVNLISNALKYTPDGGEIRVRLWEEDDQFMFEVADNGYGIPDEQQVRLFQPFFRAKTSETIRIDGTGLGLHLVKNIIERHHGKMRFHSVYGEGSSFGFEIPIPM